MEFADVLRHRRMIRTFTTEPLAEGTADRLLKAAVRAPSAGFTQGFSFLVLEGSEQCAPFWSLIFEQAEQAGDEHMHRLVEGISQAPLVIVPMASKDVYLERYGQRDKSLADEAGWPVPYWYIDAGFAALLILLAVVDEGLGAVFFGPPEFAAFRAEFGVPREWTPIGAIAVGHFDPGSNPARPGLQSRRKPLADLVHRGRW
ncbi:MAG: nitroreductase family protein [Streptosporangiaceae bacterium]|jgi:nitroreductase